MQRARRSRQGRNTRIPLKVLNGRKHGHETEAVGREGEACQLEENEEQGREGAALTYADDIHEAVHAIADLKEQILPLPLG